MKEVELLGVTLDYELKFKTHITKLCKNANRKISALIRIRNMITKKQTEILVNSYILSHFCYCPLIWMFCGKTEYNLLEKTHKRALKVLNCDFASNYQQLLEKSNTVSIHVTHLQFLMTEIYKTINLLNPKFMNQIFKTKTGTYALRDNNLLVIEKARTEMHGVRCSSFKGAVIWNKLPNPLKNAKSINVFKKNIKKWKGTECSCHICK